MIASRALEKTFNVDEQDIQRTFDEVAPVRSPLFVKPDLGRKQYFWRQTRTGNVHRKPENQALIQRERTPAPKSQSKFKRIEGAGSFPGRLKARSFSFLIIEVLFARDEGREPSTDDGLGALRESARSPSSGEVCLEVCSRQCFSLPSSIF